MATQLANFVLESANNPGTGVVTLTGAMPDRRSFISAFPQGGAVYYFLDDGTQAEWGIGTLDVSGPVTLTRVTVRGTTAGSTAPLHFAGTVRVYSDIPAEFLPLIGEDGLARVRGRILADRDWLSQNYPDRDTIAGSYSPRGWFPAGAIMDYAGPAAPAGWLLCYGQALSRTTYAALFAVIGTTYGVGDGSTTFALPDLRGRATFGVDTMGVVPAGRITADGSGIDGGQIGAAGGSEFSPRHSHGMTDPGHEHGVSDPGHDHAPARGSGFVVPAKTGGTIDAHFAGGGDDEEFATPTTGQAMTGLSLVAAGTGITIRTAGQGGSQNMPPAMMLNKIIYTGLDPQY